MRVWSSTTSRKLYFLWKFNILEEEIFFILHFMHPKWQLHSTHTHHLKNGRDKMNEPQGFLMRGCSTYFLVKKKLMRKLIARLNIYGWSSQESFNQLRTIIKFCRLKTFPSVFKAMIKKQIYLCNKLGQFRGISQYLKIVAAVECIAVN